MIGAFRAEWSKLRTLAGTSWMLVASVGMTIGVSAGVDATAHVALESGQDSAKLALSGIYLGQTAIVVLAVVVISDEYGTGMIRATFTAIPRRMLVLAAKAANLVGLTFVAGFVAVGGCLLVGRLMLPSDDLNTGHSYTLVSIGNGATLRAAVGTVLYLVLIAALSLGVAAAIRDTTVSIGAVLGLLFLPSILAQVVADPLRRHLEQLAPMSAGLAIQSTANLAAQPISPWTGLCVLGGWAVGALLIGALLLHLRDA
jgi:ABC-2 type transport system permease protein